jgi:hypothetical protein
MGVDQISTHQTHSLAATNPFGPMALPTVEVAEWEAQLARFLSRWYVGFIKDLIEHQLAEDRMVYRCVAGRKIAVFMPDGRTFPCEPFAFEDVYAGFPTMNIRDFDYDVTRLQGSPEYRHMLDFIAGAKCEACPWSCAAVTSMTYEPRNWPLVWRVPRAL